jgi:hypothetical protein
VSEPTTEQITIIIIIDISRSLSISIFLSSVEVLEEFKLPLKLLVGVKISTDVVVSLVSKSSVSVPVPDPDPVSVPVPDPASVLVLVPVFDGDGVSYVGVSIGDGVLGKNIVVLVVFGDTMEGVVETISNVVFVSVLFFTTWFKIDESFIVVLNNVVLYLVLLSKVERLVFDMLGVCVVIGVTEILFMHNIILIS